jgi:HSP20 family protein
MPKGTFWSKISGGDVTADEETQVSETQEQEVTPGEEQGGEGGREWLEEFEGQLAVDVFQTKDNIVIKSTIAGCKPEDLDITIAGDMVTIKGERRHDEEVTQEDYFYQECYWGSFSRSIILPVDIDPEGVTAELKDGILTVTLPKAAKAKLKKVKVQKTNKRSDDTED